MTQTLIDGTIYSCTSTKSSCSSPKGYPDPAKAAQAVRICGTCGLAIPAHYSVCYSCGAPEASTSVQEPPVRQALVTHVVTLREVEAYLPSNYSVVRSEVGPLIFGRDNAGWTLGYVIDRLASGLIFAKEVGV